MGRVQTTIRGLVLLGLVAAAVLVLGRGLVALTGGNPIIGSFQSSPRGGCPQTDNCVSTLAEEERWAIEPIECSGDPGARLAAIDAAVRAERDVDVREPGASYVVYSRLFRFPDDVRVRTSERGIEVLSSSRLGAGDMGVNRARVERLRARVAADDRC